jgi:hypothetical protein
MAGVGVALGLHEEVAIRRDGLDRPAQVSAMDLTQMSELLPGPGEFTTALDQLAVQSPCGAPTRRW